MEAAIADLSELDLRKLKKAARYRIRGLGRKAGQRDWDDLLQETILAFLRPDGRKWKKDEVDIVRTLNEAMRSVADNWRRSSPEKEARLESELITTSESGDQSNPLNEVGDPNDSSQQKDLEVKEKLAKIEELINPRELASLILMGMNDGLTGPEIKAELDISQTQFETEMTWIRRKIRPIFQKGVAT